MSGKTKIVVLKAREFIYTMIFIALLIVLTCILFWMFRDQNTSLHTSANAIYNPGIYTAGVTLGSETLNLEITVDETQITHVGLVNTSETVTTMYPLVTSSIDEINQQLPTITDPDELTFSNENQYTTVILKQAIEAALEKAYMQ